MNVHTAYNYFRGRGGCSWTNDTTTKISVNYSNYISQTKQSEFVQTLCTNTKNVETLMTRLCWIAAATDVQTSTAACMCHTNVSSKDFGKIFTGLKVVKVNTEQWMGNRREWMYCTFFTCKEHTPDKRQSSHPGLVGCSCIRNVCS